MITGIRSRLRRYEKTGYTRPFSPRNLSAHRLSISMETLGFVHVVLLGCCIMAALYSGWLLTETRHRLADKHRLLDRKPFSCRPCLTFHLGWMLSGLVALAIGNLPFFVLGIVVSLFVWAVLEIENRSKIDE